MYLIQILVLRYNSSHHSAIAMPPFQALYDQVVPDLNRYHPGICPMPSIDATLKEHQRHRSILKDNLRKAQQRMTSLANTHMLDKEFHVGDIVYLHLRLSPKDSSFQRYKKVNQTVFWTIQNHRKNRQSNIPPTVTNSGSDSLCLSCIITKTSLWKSDTHSVTTVGRA